LDALEGILKIRRSIRLLLVVPALLAACGSRRPTDLSPAASTLSPTSTQFSSSLHLPLVKECAGIGVHSEVRYIIRFTDYPGPDITILDQTLGPSREPRTFTLEPGPTLDQAIAFLTDGHDGRVMTQVETANGGCSSLVSEAAFLALVTGLNDKPIDFAGYVVDTIDVRLFEVSLESPGRDPNGDGNWTEEVIRAELSIYGDFPFSPTIMPAHTQTARGDTPTVSPSSTRPAPVTELPSEPSPTPGPPFPGADQWLLRLPGMQFVSLEPLRDGGYLLLARAEPHRSDLTALFRLNARGEIIWQKQFPGYNTSGAFEAADGGLVLFNTGGLTRLDSDGVFEWYEPLDYAGDSAVQAAYGQFQSSQGGSNQTIALGSSISILASDGSLVEQQVLSGKLPDEVRTRWLTPDASWSAGPIDYRGFFVQRLSAGGASWLRRFDLTYTGSDVHPQGMSIIGTRDGGALFAALVPYLRGDLARYISIWTVRLNSRGDVIWQKAIDGAEEFDLQVLQTADGGFVIATSSGYMVDEIRPLRILRLNAYGGVLWDRFYRPGLGRVVPEAVREGSDGNLVIAARALEGWQEGEIGDLLLLKIDRDGRVMSCPWLEAPPFDPPIRTSAPSELENLPGASLATAGLITEKTSSGADEYEDAAYAFDAICAFPPPTPSPTPTPLPTPSPAAPEPGRLYPFGVSSAVLLGASRDGKWLQPDDAAARLTAPMRFGLYGSAGYQGELTGTFRIDGLMASCPGHPWIDFTSPPPAPDLIAVSGPWEVQPRPVREIVVSDTYITVVEDFLRQLGMPETPIEIEHIYRFDIEGDGFEEVLISASHLEGNSITHGAAAGDYSMLILRTLVDGQVASLPLVEQHYPSTRPGTDPVRFRIGGILDLNGDGALDLVAVAEDGISTQYWTFDLTQPAFGPVVQTSCKP
jgi:hypothetical protein